MNKENTFLLFVSSAPEDAERVSHLVEELTAQGFSFWGDQNANRPDHPSEEDVLQRAIRASSALLLVASPYTRNARSVKAVLSIAQMYQRPVYAVWINGETWIEVLPPGWGGIGVIDARGEQYAQAFQTLVQKLGHLQDSSNAQPEPILSLMDPSAHSRNPYKGLRFFQKEDAGDFFGREQCIENLLYALRETLLAVQPISRFLAVIGPRGSGKSSIIMAGLLPQLQQGRLSQSHEWIYLQRMVPGQHPLEALAFALAHRFPGRGVNSIMEELEDVRGLHRLATSLVECEAGDGPGGNHTTATTSRERRDTDELVASPFFNRPTSALLERRDTKVLLFVDQFEELFTQTRSDQERQHFLDLLVTAMTEPQSPVVVLVALRADSYDRPLRYPVLAKLIEEHHKLILPMAVQELRAAIEKPALQPDVQLRFEDDLVGDLLFDAQEPSEALPLLQFTLTQLFARRDRVYLTHRAYGEIGGVSGALAKQAESTFLSLPSQEHQRWARALFLRLIDPGSVNRYLTCRRIPLSALTLISTRETAVLATVWKTFAEKGLLTTSTLMGIPSIEMVHEALIGAWERLTKWLQDALEESYMHGRMSNDAAEWIRLGQPAGRLYRDEQLAAAQRWRTRTIPSRDEDTFLQASIRQQHRERHRTTRRAVVVGIAALGLVGGAFSLGRLLDAGEARPDQTPPPIQKLPYTYNGHKGAVLSVAWSPDGKRIASASADRTVQVWEVESGTPPLTYNGHKSFVLSVAWSPDGTRIASASDDRTVQVWDAESASTIVTYRGHGGTVWSVSWSPDGSRIASASFDRSAHVWNPDSGERLLTYRGHDGTVNSVAWSPDGSRIASASDDRTVQVWDARSGKPHLSYRGHGGTVESAKWSPDGSRIASASVDRTVQVWDARSGRPHLTYRGHGGTVNSVAWSPDGTHLASASTRTVQVWDAASGNRLLMYQGHRGFVVYCVVWSPDGKRIASASFDQTVQVWEAVTR